MNRVYVGSRNWGNIIQLPQDNYTGYGVGVHETGVALSQDCLHQVTESSVDKSDKASTVEGHGPHGSSFWGLPFRILI